MLFLLVSFVFSYNIWRGDCVAILDRYKYDLTRFVGKTLTNYTDNNIYYLRLCPENDRGDTADVFVLQCPKSAPSCRYLITQNSLDYKPRNPNNFSEGVIYFASSEPFSDDDGKTYKTLDLQYDLICDPTATGSDVEFTLTFDESQLGMITARAHTAAGCPEIVPSPTPTPDYQPECDYTDRIDDNITFGIKGNLNALNDGPFGIKSELIIDGYKKYLYYQPCERMLCPPTYTCSTNGYSSAWLCEIKGETRTCESYGVGVENVDFHPLDEDHLDRGMLLRLEDETTKKAVNFTLQCVNEESYPEGHIKFPNVASIKDDTLFMFGSAAEMCIRPIPTTTPVPAEVCAYESVVYDNKKISMNLLNLNLGDVGWSSNVQIIGDRDHPNSKLIYQPCGSLKCPDGVFCDGDEDAQVWLCYDDDDDVKTCIGYGLYKNNVSVSLYIPGSLTGGVNAKYKGDMKRMADVIYLCDEELTSSVITLPESVTMSSRTLSFYVYSKQACPVNATDGGGGDDGGDDDDDDGDDGDKKRKVTGGAIFLIIIAVAAVFYFAFGTIFIYIKEGAIHIPNEDFWRTFGECVVTGATFIFTCGKKTDIILQSNYENLK